MVHFFLVLFFFFLFFIGNPEDAAGNDSGEHEWNGFVTSYVRCKVQAGFGSAGRREARVIRCVLVYNTSLFLDL